MGASAAVCDRPWAEMRENAGERCVNILDHEVRQSRNANAVGDEHRGHAASVHGPYGFLVLDERDLAAAVPCLHHYKLSGVPRGISEADALKTLECIDRTTPPGRRDFAIIVESSVRLSSSPTFLSGSFI